MFPVGTRIRFKETLSKRSDEDSPSSIYAYKGELGVVTGHGCKEGYWVKPDGMWASFGASEHEFEAAIAAAKEVRDE